MTTRQLSRFAGSLYIAMSVPFVLGEVVIPSRIGVSADAAESIRAIAAHPDAWRFAVALSLIAQALYLCTGLALFELFERVHRPLARLLLLFVTTQVAVAMVGAASRLRALHGGSLTLSDDLGTAVILFYGLWLFPFAALTQRSGWFPRILGILLYIAAIAWTTRWAILTLAPEQADTFLGRAAGIGTQLELVMVFWLPIVGARERIPKPTLIAA